MSKTAECFGEGWGLALSWLVSFGGALEGGVGWGGSFEQTQERVAVLGGERGDLLGRVGRFGGFGGRIGVG